MSRKPMLDIIMPHYNEPWEVGAKFFNMLCLQRGVNFPDIRIIIVQDGKETSLPWNDLLDQYPFQIKVKTIKHMGVSAARNAGLNLATADWVMFCDFDDTFATIHALRKFLTVANMNQHDLIFSHLYGEVQDGDGGFKLITYGENDTFIHAKMFRRRFLMEEQLFFEPGVDFGEDTLFCNVMKIPLIPSRVHEIPEILYTRCWYDNSVCHDELNSRRNAIGIFNCRKALTRAYRDRNCPMNYTGTVVKTVFDYYYALMYPDYPDPEYFEEDFYHYWMAYKDVFESADRNLIAYEKDRAHTEAAHKGFIGIEPMTFTAWVAKIVRKYGLVNMP